jgi:agmatinase
MDDRRENREAMPAGPVALFGIPWDRNASFLRGASLGPGRIREALHSGSSNLCTEAGQDLSRDPRWRDLGDLDLDGEKEPLKRVEEEVTRILSRGFRLLSLGGDHSITYPILRAYSRTFPELTVLQLDAHPDLYDELDGNPFSHACPFSRIMEEGRISRLVQVGVRSITPHQIEQARRFGVEVVAMQDWHMRRDLKLTGALYLSLDLDVLDPAFAPGTSHNEPGGFTSREVLGIVQGLKVPLVGADIVELNPLRDPTGITAMLAAKLLKEILGRMLEEM